MHPSPWRKQPTSWNKVCQSLGRCDLERAPLVRSFSAAGGMSPPVNLENMCGVLDMQRYLLPLLTVLALSPEPAQAAGVIVVAGGGSEGDVGDTTAWSYKLYRKLVQNGDVNGDGKIKVAILSTGVETSWLPDYFKWLGATEAVNVKVTTRADANNSAVVDTVSTSDVVFLKGGDQGAYYDAWNGTLLETHIRTVVETRNGAIGGTSAGAMSQSQYAFAGGKDLVSLDVLTDAKTAYLDDTDGGSGIHNDFLGFIPNTLIDTHYTSRARLGRLAGLLGKAVQDYAVPSLLAIGLEERTGLAITGTSAEVIGVGSVDLIQQTTSTVLRRDTRRPLFYTHLRVDRLTEGWTFDVAKRTVDMGRLPSGAVAVTYLGDSAANSGSLTISGTQPTDEDRFEYTVSYTPFPYSTEPGTYTTYVRSSVGLVDAQDTDLRGAIHESLFRALYDHPSYTGFLVADSGQLSRSSSTPDQLQFGRNSRSSYAEAASIVVDGKTVTHKSLSPYVSNLDTGSGSLKAAGFINLRVHILAESRSSSRGAMYNTRTHTVVGGPKP